MIMEYLSKAAEPFCRESVMHILSELDSPEQMRDQLARRPLKPGDHVALLDYDVCINDSDNYFILYKDIFCKQLYHFDCDRPDPLILDCGSNIGFSILYFKHTYPAARIVGFEPDPTVLPYLRGNMERNKLADVEIVAAALASHSGEGILYADGLYGSALEDCGGAQRRGVTPVGPVDCVRLLDYLDQPVGFLKMNIEGAEWGVLEDSEERLGSISRMVIEYHHLPGLPRTLHKILDLLDRTGFDYLIHDFDRETNPKSQPPFRLGPDSEYFLLVYAQRRC